MDSLAPPAKRMCLAHPASPCFSGGPSESVGRPAHVRAPEVKSRRQLHTLENPVANLDDSFAFWRPGSQKSTTAQHFGGPGGQQSTPASHSGEPGGKLTRAGLVPTRWVSICVWVRANNFFAEISGAFFGALTGVGITREGIAGTNRPFFFLAGQKCISRRLFFKESRFAKALRSISPTSLLVLVRVRSVLVLGSGPRSDLWFGGCSFWPGHRLACFAFGQGAAPREGSWDGRVAPREGIRSVERGGRKTTFRSALATAQLREPPLQLNKGFQ